MTKHVIFPSVVSFGEKESNQKRYDVIRWTRHEGKSKRKINTARGVAASLIR